jgi:hypothetical protein
VSPGRTTVDLNYDSTMGPDVDDDSTIDLTLSERVARANSSPAAVSLDDGTILIELTLHRLEPSALPRPTIKPGFFTRVRRRFGAPPGPTSQVRYVQTRHGDDGAP